MSGQTIKRIVKKSRLIWKRVRTSLKSQRDPKKFAQSKTEIMQLTIRQERGEIDLYYGDEVGFNLIPKIPYAWQRIGENIELASSRSKSFNVLGLLQKNGEFESVVFDQSINSHAIVGYLGHLAEKICKETWIILDNSPIHKSDYFMEQIPLWKEKGLNIYFCNYSAQVIRVYKQILAIYLQIISSMLQQHLRHASGTWIDSL